MSILIVVNNPKEWSLTIPGVQVIAAKTYLTDTSYSELRGAKVFNLSRSYRYQSVGYYVSLLAEARGHKPLPSINTIQDMKSQTITRFVSEELDELLQKSLAKIEEKEFTLSIYFGRNIDTIFEKLSLHLFNLFPAPLLRAKFVLQRQWQLQSINPIATNDIPLNHHDFFIEAARQHFERKRPITRKPRTARYDMAILTNPGETSAPSDSVAIKRFVRGAEAVGFDVEMITKQDYGRIAEFDALFIRETTHVNHHTFRFARRAVAEGLVVIDDPESILKCTNKVYLAELLTRHRIPTPKTSIITKENLSAMAKEQTMPCILKQPDSAFSAGVLKVQNIEEFHQQGQRMLEKSDLIITQEFLPTPYDWRVGIFNRQPLFVCKYYMAKEHWQVIHRDHTGITHEGTADVFNFDEVPPKVIQMALKAANLIGNGLYGVDVKEINGTVYVIEINDNPNIDGGSEDGILKNNLYLIIMREMMRRVDQLKGVRAKD